MAKTRHLNKRMSQRGITNETLKLVTKYGVKQGDIRMLNRKSCDDLLTVLNDLKKTVAKARERGGFFLIEDNDNLITIYAIDSYSRKKSRLN